MMLATLISLLMALTGPTHPLTLVLDGVEDAQGEVRVALYDRPTDFSDATAAYRVGSVVAEAGSVTVTFADVPPGEYAVAAFHDRDGSGEISTNFIGMPTEAYGFSNDARGVFGPPAYAECTFAVRGDTTLRVRLR